MKLQLKKILSIILIAQILLLNVVPVVQAEEATPTETPTANSTDSAPQDTTPTPTTEVTPTQTEQPADVSPTPTQDTAIESNTNNDNEESEEEERAKLEERRARAREAAEAYLQTMPVEEGDINRTESATSALQAGVDLQGVVGDSNIQTGDSTVTSAITNTGNNNLAENGAIIGESEANIEEGAQVVTSGNGSFSDNSGTLVLDNDSITIQDNTANVNSSLNQSATTGNNNNSQNVGGNSTIETGDANTSGTVITAVNTNASGIMVSEFNITDDQVGDFILDFQAGCVIGCGNGYASVENTGNGSFSDNDASINETNNNQTFQNNDANIENELMLAADSGNNSTNNNTGGNSNITTGNANVSANAITLANNNIAGDVIYAVVNIFGDLIGDILLPEDTINNCCGASDLSAANIGNGSLSDNDANITNDNNTIIDQNNLAEINNNLIIDAQTGNNSTSNNTGGDSTITTGNTDVTASLLNIVNNNLSGGNMWLVLINEAGNWVGRLLGAPEGSNMAASQGTVLGVDSNGQIFATNNGNGTGSDNNASVSQTNNNTTTQTNNATVNNTLDLSANTGGNTANNNTGGNSNITTGDAKIIANLINFVNNNIVGNGKLVVTVVNVFGNWFGDFVAPGQTKRNDTSELAQNPNTNSNTDTPNNEIITAESRDSNPQTTASNNEPHTGFVAGISQSIKNAIAQNFNEYGNDNKAAETNSTASNNLTIKVAGINTSDNKLLADASYKNNYSTKTKSIKINLAWLIFIIPVVGAVIFGKYFIWKKYFLKKQYNKYI